MDSSTVYNGKVYVFRVKCTNDKDWDANDIIFGIGREGDDGITYNRFKDLSYRKNKKYFFCKKANSTTDDNCTGAEIKRVLEDYIPIGSPVLSFVDTPVSWYMVAKAAYEKGLFTDKAALKALEASVDEIGKRTASNDAIASPTDKPSVFEKARRDAMALAKNKDSSFTTGLSQGAGLLAGISPPPDGSSESSAGSSGSSAGSSGSSAGSSGSSGKRVDWGSLAREEIGRVADEWKARTIEAEDQITALEDIVNQREENNYDLQIKLKAVKNDLEAALADKAKFMAVADRMTLENEVVKKASSSLLEGLKPLIANELQPIKTLLNSFTSSFAKIQEALANFDTLKEKLTALKSTATGNREVVLSEIMSGTDAVTGILDQIKSAVENLGVNHEDASQSPAVAASTASSTKTVKQVSISYQPMPQRTSAVGGAVYTSSVLHNQYTTPPPPFNQVGGDGNPTGAAGVSGHEHYGGGEARGRGRGRGGWKANGKKMHQRDKIQAKRSLQYDNSASSAVTTSQPTVESLQRQLLMLQQQHQQK